MSETNRSERNFVAYEYTTLQVQRNELQEYKDCYRNFGWLPVEEAIGLSGIVLLKLKRDRMLKNHAELGNLQRQAEAAFSAIGKLERTKTERASMVALGTGVLGTAFMAGSVFAVVAGNIPLCVVVGIPGLVGWGAAYLLYRKIMKSQIAQVSPLIDQQYEEIYRACEQASALLA